MSAEIVPWRAPESSMLPTSATSPAEFMSYAIALKSNEQQRIIDALTQGFHELGAEFVWKRSLDRLKSTLSTLGMQFVGEMLERSDINQFSQPDTVLTDWDAIRLAENLGVVTRTGAIKLRHAFELLSHLSRTEEEELEVNDAVSLIRSCVKYVLAEQNFGIAVDFSRFRDRLVSETLSKDEQQIQNLLGSPQFFQKTALRALLATIKTETAARLEHALNNLNLLLPEIWSKIREEDKWAVGTTYAEAANENKSDVVKALRRSLLRVSGFDYVPESLRSNTFKQAAQALITAHFSLNNFHTEVGLTSQLAQLGTFIPKPALIDCMRAYLCVYIGNRYGYSFDAAPLAGTELKKISADRWGYFINRVVISDEIILPKLSEDRPVQRFCNLISTTDVNFGDERAQDARKLVELAKAKRVSEIKFFASFHERRIRGDAVAQG